MVSFNHRLSSIKTDTLSRYLTLVNANHASSNWTQIVKNDKVINQVNIGSDHRIVRCGVQMDTKRPLAKEPRSPSKKL